MEPGDGKWLARTLYEQGKKLSKSSQSRVDTLCILSRLEEILSLVEQSPSALLQIAMGHAVTALGEHRYLRHNDSEIRLVVALCYSQFMRITVPLVPYSGNTMREVFQLIINCMAGIGDIGSPIYARKVKVLEIMAQIRSCVAMLNYDQHDLVLQLFRLFVKSISSGMTGVYRTT